MFNRIRVKNFRSIADSKDLNLSRLNIFVGPNNSGKSSILYSLLLLKQTLEDKERDSVLVTSGPHVDLGGYLDIVRDHKSKESIMIEFDLNEKVVPEMRIREFKKAKESVTRGFDQYKMEFGFKQKRNEIYLLSFDVFESASKANLRGKYLKSKWSLKGIPPKLKPHVRPNFDHFLPHLGPAGKKPRNKKFLMEAQELFFKSYMRVDFVSHLFRNIFYVGPIREHIPRYGILGTMPYSELGPSGQNLMRVLSQVTGHGRAKTTVLQELNYWLDEKFHLLKKVRILDIDEGKTVKALVAEDNRGGKSINLTATGSGISQLLPVVVQTVLTPQRGCLIVEQPEIHLHPAAQADLADLFVHYGSQGKQLIVETHSEHLLLRIRRRVAERKISPELVRIFLVEKSSGITKIKCLQLEKNGHFRQWPKGFFEEGYKEAMGIAEAQVK